MTKLKLKALLLILFCTTLMNVNVSAMEEAQPADVLYVLPEELVSMIFVANLVAHLNDSNNIHELLQRIATLYKVSKNVKKYCEQRYPDLLVVIHGIDSNDQDYDNKIAATKASLYNRGFSINDRGHRARTLLHQAAKHGDLNIVKTLLSLGANYKLFDSLNCSAYTLAQAMENSGITDIFDTILSDDDKKLLKKTKPYKATYVATKALVNEDFKSFDTWLNEQTKESITQQFYQDSIYDWLIRTIESTEKLIKYMKHIQDLGLYPTVELIYTACKANNLPALECLLKVREIPPTQAELNKALMIDVQYRRPATISYLIDNGANVNDINKLSGTPLIYAAYKGYTDILKLLIENGAHANHINNRGKTALDYARMKGRTDAVDYLESLKSTKAVMKEQNLKKQFLLAANWGDLDTCQRLIAQGLDVNAVSLVGDTALINAARAGYLEICKWLIKKGANVNHADSLGDTVLIRATFGNHLEIVKLLIDNKANVNRENYVGNTALISSVQDDNYESVKLLVKKGANVNHADNDGKTALMWAAFMGHLKNCKLLIENGAHANHINNRGKTALIWAQQLGHTDVADYLKSIAESDTLADGVANVQV